MKSIARPLFLLLLLTAVLMGCGRVPPQEQPSSAPVSSDLPPEVTSSSSSLVPEQSDAAGESISSEVIPELENLSAEYARWLSGLWRDPEQEEYYFGEDGEGTWTDVEENDLLRFSWQVLQERDGQPMLYLFREGAAESRKLTPVFDVGRLTLLDEAGEVLCTLESVDARD